jgi:hypothetical protein
MALGRILQVMKITVVCDVITQGCPGRRVSGAQLYETT